MAKDYSELTQEELIDLIYRLEKKRKYGLVWDEEQAPEEVVQNCSKFLPVLKPLEVKGIVNKGLQDHVLIQGDNFHALSVLSYTHKNQIDLIYIDPPYNTGNQEDEEGFVYNDKRVDSDDTYRHSKWLNFMSRRLELSRDLLKDSGFCFISIDEHEFAQLRLVCAQIFGEENFVNFLTWKKRSTGGQVKDGSIITQTEFIFIYAKNKKIGKLNKIDNPNVGTEKWRDFRKSGGQWQRRHRPKQYYPFFFDSKNDGLSLERVRKTDVEIFPLDSKGEEGFWENGVDTATKRLKNGEFKVELIKSGLLKGTYKVKQLEVASDVQNVGNFVDIPSVQGANEIRELGLAFNNAKDSSRSIVFGADTDDSRPFISTALSISEKLSLVWVWSTVTGVVTVRGTVFGTYAGIGALTGTGAGTSASSSTIGICSSTSLTSTSCSSVSSIYARRIVSTGILSLTEFIIHSLIIISNSRLCFCTCKGAIFFSNK